MVLSRIRGRWLWWPIAIALGLFVILYSGASWYLAYQVTVSERNPLEAHPEDYGLAYERVSFTPRGSDIELQGWYLPTDDGAPTIIITHGINSNRADTNIGLLEIARDLHQRSFAVLMFDLRGHGESGGNRFNGGYAERMDTLGAFDYLLERGTPPAEIGLLGYSLGGGITLMAAGEEPRIKAVVADSPFASTEDLIVSEVGRRTDAPAWSVPALIPGLKTAAHLIYGIDIGAIRPIDAAANLEYPILLIHGTADERIPYTHSLRIKEASSNPKTELWLVEGVEHVKSYQANPTEYIEKVTAYFLDRLDG